MMLLVKLPRRRYVNGNLVMLLVKLPRRRYVNGNLVGVAQSLAGP